MNDLLYVQPDRPITPPQFGLQVMFIALTIGSLWLAVFTWYGSHAAGIIVPFMCVAVFVESAIFGLQRWYVLGYSVFGMCVGMLWFASLNLPTAAEVRAQELRQQSLQNLVQIKYALWNYEDVHGRYPPIATFDSRGNAVHSWRAFILPQLELNRLGRYDFSEPWDGPSNAEWKTRQLKVFQNPTDSHFRSGTTNYLAIVMPQAKPGDRFAVIELPATDVQYLEPRDIKLPELLARLTQPDRERIRGTHDRGNQLRVLWPNRDIELIHIRDLAERLAELEPGLPPPQSVQAARSARK